MSVESIESITNEEVEKCIDQLIRHCEPSDDFLIAAPTIIKLCCFKVLNRYLKDDLGKMKEDLQKLNRG
jgi:hypothetical protein